MVGSNIAILTLKTGPLTVFFTEKRYKSINIGCISNNTSNTIHTPPGLFNIRIKVLNSEIRSSVKGHYSAALSSPPQITIFFLYQKGYKSC